MCEAIYLMYHEIEQMGRTPASSEPGYLRYVLYKQNFAEQMAYLFQSRRQVMNITEARSLTTNPQQFPTSNPVVLTFDDGYETDYTIAAPILYSYQFNATFFVIAGAIGKPGFLSAAQLRELRQQGFEIGCHSMTHKYLTDLSDRELTTEIVEAKDRLQQLLGEPMAHFSCPGGRWSDKIALAVKTAGFSTLSTSKTGTNSSSANPYALNRISMIRGLNLNQFADICDGKGFLKRKIVEGTLNSTKNLLGNSFYEKIRARFLSLQTP